jgi:methionyl-tRNA synthetase
MDKPILILSALPYVNNVPHLGNVIGSTLSGDVLSRYYKMIGRKVLYLCGTDEYGTCTVVKSVEEKISCRDLCDKYHKIHKECYEWFNIKFDVFGRTTTDTQTELTHEIFLELYKNKHIEEKEIDELKCNTCNLVLADRYIKGLCYNSKCSKDNIIANGDQCDNCGDLMDVSKFTKYWCSVCNSIPEKIRTKHLFLKLKDFEKKIYDYFIDQKSDNKVKINNLAKSLTKGFLKKGLESRCITRTLSWGTPVPQSKEYPELAEYKDKVFYVWFDAPIGYYSILKRARPDDWKEWLSGEIINVHAKDNVIFHTVMFPATLMGSSLKYPLPTSIAATNFLQFENKKFSKSKSIGIFVDDAIKISEKYNITEDYWRFYLLKIRPETSDSSFNMKDFRIVIKSELIANIGNFINRCMSLSCKYYKKENNKVNFTYNFEDNKDTFQEIESIITDYHKYFNEYSLNNILALIIRIAKLGNQFVQHKDVYKLCKNEPQKYKNLLGCSNFIVCLLIKLFYPVMPSKSEELCNNFVCDINLLDIKPSGNLYISDNNYKLPFNNFNYQDEILQKY